MTEFQFQAYKESSVLYLLASLNPKEMARKGL